MPLLTQRKDGSPRCYTTPGGASVPSVTEVLSVLDGVWMNGFLQRAGRREAERTLREAAALGTKVHTVADKLARDRGTRVEPEMRPYARAIQEFLDTHVRRVIATELSLSSERLGFGGTVDLVCELQDGSLALVDYKTSASGVTKIHKLQTAAYAMLCLEHGYRIKERLVVRLHKCDERRGEWYVRAALSHKQDVEVFKACVVVWNFLHGAKLNKERKA